MQGILIVNKPQGFTSFDVVAKLRGICGTRKIGHSGTLDPMATGVLPVFIGNAAKAVDRQPRHDKVYTAAMLLGKRTDTGDITGQVLEEAEVPREICAAAIEAVLPRFIGEGEQLPPMYSAVKINGQPLYKAARAGKTVERTPRPIVIHSLSLTQTLGACEYELRIHCGKGTYVRTLLEDIGAALGVPATMSALCRTAAGVHTLQNAHTFEEIIAAKNAGTLEALLMPVESVFAHLPAALVDDATKARLLNGAPTYRFEAELGEKRLLCGGEFLGIGRVEDEGETRTLRAVKLFVERGE